MTGSGSIDTVKREDKSAQPPHFLSDIPSDVDDGDDEDISTHETDDDDEVIADYPIYLHHSLTSHLYLVASPFRPSTRPYSSDVGPLHSVRVKPQQKRVELEYKLHRDEDEQSSPSSSPSPRHSSTPSPPPSSNYDPHSAHRLTSVLYHGRPVPAKTNYCIGSFHDSALHLTPLHATVRLKPDLTYLDVAAAEELLMVEAARKEVEREKMERDGEWSMEDERKDHMDEADELMANEGKSNGQPKEKEKEMRQLTVRFKKKETEKSASYRTASHAYIKQMEEKEQWIPLTPFPQHTPQANKEKEQLTSPPPPSSAEGMTTPAYLHYLNPHSPAHLTSSTLPDRLLSLLRSARVVPLFIILSKLGVGIEGRDEAVHWCDRFAYYVQGAFVVKSVLVFDVSVSAMSMEGTGVKSEREREVRDRERRTPSRDEMCRDYLLCQFYVTPVVYRDRVSSVMRLDVETTETRLKELAEKREGIGRGGWQWKWREDDRELHLTSSLPSFPLLLKAQEKQIKEMETRARWALESQPTTPPPPSTSLIINHNEPSPTLPSTSLQSSAFSLLTHLFREHGVCSEPYLITQFHSSPPPLSTLTPDSIRTFIAAFSLPITPSLFIRKTLSNPAVDRYRSVIASLFAVRSCVKKGDVLRAIEDCYGDEIPDNLYRKVMKEFATFEKGIWTLKTGEYQ